MTVDAREARIRAHQNNLDRYRRLLDTRLTRQEEQFVNARISEEYEALSRLLASPPSDGLADPETVIASSALAADRRGQSQSA